MTAYYNEHDEFAAQWLRNLIAAGHIAPGDVDTRDLWDVRPSDLSAYTQVHFCAGIGIWSLALRNAGWGDSRHIWTGSFPCQPLSAAGKGLGDADPRHLWPCGRHLIRECRPTVVLGEQVASPLGLRWLEGVQADMEAEGYAFGAADTCAAGFADDQGNEGFHIRQRLYWGARRMGDADNARSQRRLLGRDGADQRATGASGVAGEAGGLGHAESDGRLGRSHDGDSGRRERSSGQAGADGGVADAHGRHAGAERQQPSGQYGQQPQNGVSGVDWLPCRDGKLRPVESGTFPLAHEDPQRVGRLRAYGNALDAAQAEGFVRAWMECAP